MYEMAAVLAYIPSGIRLLSEKDLRERAQAEFLKDMGGRTYRCPIPEGLSPEP